MNPDPKFSHSADCAIRKAASWDADECDCGFVRRPLGRTSADVSHDTPRCTQTRDFFETNEPLSSTSKSL